MGNDDAVSGNKSSVKKSDRAFRTISEVADLFGLQQHVLRFWESKFAQLRPMKRGGGRRYYRPDDVHLVERIKCLLHDDGYTIKGVQKLLREGNAKQAGGPKPAPKAVTPSEPAAEATHAPTPRTPESKGLSDQTRAEMMAVLAELKDLKNLLDSKAA